MCDKKFTSLSVSWVYFINSKSADGTNTDSKAQKHEYIFLLWTTKNISGPIAYALMNIKINATISDNLPQNIAQKDLNIPRKYWVTRNTPIVCALNLWHLLGKCQIRVLMSFDFWIISVDASKRNFVQNAVRYSGSCIQIFFK